MIVLAVMIVCLAACRAQYVRGQHLAHRRAVTRVQLRTNQETT